MRTIKFKAWDVQGKEMYYGKNTDAILTYNNGEFGLQVDTHYPDHKLWNGEDHEIPVFDSIEEFNVMQFTGLLDKNGKEIYEGDILKFLPHYPHDFQERYPWKKHGLIGNGVSWKDGWLYADTTFADRKEEQLLVGKDGVVDEWEVIGNIYENKDLLV